MRTFLLACFAILALCVAAVKLAASEPPPRRMAEAGPRPADDPFPVTTSFGGMPPQRFKGEAIVPVGFLYIDALGEVCGKAELPLTRLGCANRKVVAIIHPCAPIFKGEIFARLMCHEIAHVHGWPASHGP